MKTAIDMINIQLKIIDSELTYTRENLNTYMKRIEVCKNRIEDHETKKRELNAAKTALEKME